MEAVGSGLTKLVVEVVAEQGAALALFTDLGFSGEALLTDHIRDRSGQLRDLMVLAHHVGQTWSGMDAVGIEDELARLTQRSVTCPPATSSRRVVLTDSSIRRSWVTRSSVPV